MMLSSSLFCRWRNQNCRALSHLSSHTSGKVWPSLNPTFLKPPLPSRNPVTVQYKEELEIEGTRRLKLLTSQKMKVVFLRWSLTVYVTIYWGFLHWVRRVSNVFLTSILMLMLCDCKLYICLKIRMLDSKRFYIVVFVFHMFLNQLDFVL